MKNTKLKKIITCILLVSLAGGLLYGYRSYKAYQAMPQVVLAETDFASLTRSIFIQAQIEPQKSQFIYAERQLPIEKLYVKEGDFVESGDKLLLYSAKAAKKQLKEARSDLARLEEERAEQKAEFQEIFKEISSSLTAEMSAGMQSALGGLSGNLSESLGELSKLNLKEQMEKLLPSGLTDIEIDPQQVDRLLDNLELGLYNTASMTGNIATLVAQVGMSGMTELTVENLYSALLQGQSLYQEVCAILESLNSLTQDLANTSTEVRQRIEELKAKATEQKNNLQKLLLELQELLDEWGKDLPFPSDNTTAPDSQILPPPLPPGEDGLDQPDEGSDSIDNPATEPSNTVPLATPSQESETSITNTEFSTNDPDNTEDQTESSTSSKETPFTSETESNDSGKDEKTQATQPRLGAELSYLASENQPAQGQATTINPVLLLSLMQMSEAQSQNAQEDLKAKISRLENLIEKNDFLVKAEFPGLVAKIATQEGEVSPADSLEMLIVDNHDLCAVARLGKKDAGLVSEGQKVIFDYEGIKLEGEVKYKSAIASTQNLGLNSLGSLVPGLGTLSQISEEASELSGGSDPKVDIKMSMTGPQVSHLTIGFDISCEIIVEHADNVLSAPIEALLSDKGNYYVLYVDEDKRVQRKDVDVGIIDQDRAEIKAGLAPGDNIILNTLIGLKPGEKVRVVEEK